jgi:hypothetical protein
MPYIRDRDFARIKELVQTIEELGSKEGNPAIPGIAKRALVIMDKYVVEEIEKEENG